MFFSETLILLLKLSGEVLFFLAAFAQFSLVEKENRPPKLSYSFEEYSKILQILTATKS